ncbi:sensor histidine kinase [Motilimonas sp. 1_MG-2023]|uniref:sensor histidine kinase n=1 Tax=Motilimonas TaxID=1914248 RepID=UPI0026E37A1E|nr:sensor histidine kinase [Motilimonas sp. 1_MG-2023]MDO6526026.1 ATP-binding protein [Motilimonas sp. 1_MG-2023]
MQLSSLYNRLNTTSLAWLGAAIIVVAIIVNAAIGLDNIQDLANIQKRLQNTSKVMLVVDSLHIDILNAETGQRGYLLSENTSHLEPFIKALEKFSDSLKQVEQVQSQSHEQQQRIDAFARLAEAKLKSLQESVELAVGLGAEVAQQGEEEVDLTQMNIRHLYQSIIIQETNIRNDLLARLDDSRAKANRNIIWFTLLSILMSGAVLVLIAKHLNSIRTAKSNLEKYNAQLESKVQERTHALEVYAEELNRSNRELEDFAFVASHDLQEPLRKIRAFGDRLSSNYADQLGDRGMDYLARMNSAAQRMSVLISDLLELSRITTRGKPFQLVDLNDLLMRVLDDLEIAIQDSGAQITVASLPCIQADASQLSQLFSNLISNAIKFREPEQTPNIIIGANSISPPVQANISNDKPWLELTIADNGIGFSEQYSEKIFTPFQRLHSRSEYAGTGIGLAVCRRIIERHSGQISASSTPGVGATFTILLPIDADLFTVEDGKVELLKTPSN